MEIALQMLLANPGIELPNTIDDIDVGWFEAYRALDRVVQLPPPICEDDDGLHDGLEEEEHEDEEGDDDGDETDGVGETVSEAMCHDCGLCYRGGGGGGGGSGGGGGGS